MNKAMSILGKVLVVTSVICLGAAMWMFMDFNAPIIKNDWLLWIISAGALGSMLYGITLNGHYEEQKNGIMQFLMAAAMAGFMIYSILYSVLLDFFQPLSLYDQVIYTALAGLGILMVVLLISGVAAAIKGKASKGMILVMAGAAVFILQFYGLNLLQSDFDYTNIQGEPVHVFEAGESGYEIFRIPTVLVIEKGSTLADGSILNSDRVIVMAEARRNGSLDHGDIDLVQKISDDGGLTWSELMIVRTYEDGIGKIGNSTPVFDAVSGEINLLHIAGKQEGADAVGMDTFNMTSPDGGHSWTEPEFVYEGAVGPGHGIMIDSGIYEGRLVVPGYHEGGSRSLYSDDHGKTWQISEALSDGNEAEIAQISENGDLIMVVRTNIGVATPHEPLNKLYVTSDDGGSSWSEFKTMEEIKEPICMSSIVNSKGDLYYSHPDDYYSRGQMTVAVSRDEGETYPDRKVIYQGASGYSELGVLSDGTLVLGFENGAIEYDERITVVRVPRF